MIDSKTQVIISAGEYEDLLAIKEKYNEIKKKKGCVIMVKSDTTSVANYIVAFGGVTPSFYPTRYRYDTTEITTENKVIKEVIETYDTIHKSNLTTIKSLAKELSERNKEICELQIKKKSNSWF